MRVVIADDHDLFRDGLASLIESMQDHEVVAQARTTAQTLQVVATHLPDLLMLDVEMDESPVSRTIRIIRRLAPRTRILVLTMHTDRVLADMTLRAGASLFLSKGSSRSELMSAVSHPSMSPAAASAAPDREMLSHRELEVLGCLARAMSNREIASWLSIAEGTVKRHTGNIYSKLGARSRIDAVAKARVLGVVPA